MTNRTARCALLLVLGVSCLAADVTPRQLIDNGHYRRARAILEPRLQAAPDDAEALCLMSQLKFLGGDNEAALSLAEQAVKLDARNPLFHLQLARVLAEKLNHEGALQQLKLGNRFKAELQSVLSLDPNNVEALKFQHSIYYDAPAIFGGNKDKARQVAEKILQVDPVEGYFLQAELAGAEKQAGQVEEFYRKAAEAAPDRYEARVRLAFYNLRNVKNFAAAEAQACEAVRINPGRVEGYELLAASVAQQSRWDDLDKLLAQAQQAVPDDWKPCFTAAVQMVSKGVQLERADRYLQQYLSQDPELFAPSHAVARWRLGQVREKQGRAADALAEYQAALKLDPACPAKRDLERLQQSNPSPTQPAYSAPHFADLIRSISAGADSVERAQAIALQLSRLRIAYESRPFVSGPRTGANILASLPGPGPNAPVLMLGAHLDRVAQGQGSLDNASGAAVVLELLAALQRAPLSKYRVVAAFWDLEEEGLLGSQAFVTSQPHDALPAVYINFDMLGYGDTLCANWKNESSKGAEAFRKAVGDQFPLRADFEFPPSDDRSFLAAGVEVIALALGDKQDIDRGLKLLRGEDAEPPRILTIMHTAEDTPDKVVAADGVRVLPIIERAIRLMQAQ